MRVGSRHGAVKKWAVWGLGRRWCANVAKRVGRERGRMTRRTVRAVLVGLVVLSVVGWFLLRGRMEGEDDDDGADDEELEGEGKTWKPRRFDFRSVERAREKWRRKGVEGFSEEVWMGIKDDVVVGVKTGHEVARERLEKLRRSGWWSVGREVPNLLFISDEANEKLGVVGIKDYAYGLLRETGNWSRARKGETEGMPDHWFDKTGWRGDKDKNLPALHLLRRVFPGKKWYMLLDDDTYIFLENFARYVTSRQLQNRPIYTGKVFYISRCGGFLRDGTYAKNKSAPKGLFAHGGSGIVMNGDAMERLWPRIGNCILEYSSCWAGDMQVGLCMRKSGVPLLKHGGRSSYEKHFIPFWPSKALSDRRYIGRWRSLERPVTFHKIPEREEQLMSGFERKVALSGGLVVYTELREFLTENGIVPCHTEHNKKVKWYTTEFMPPGFKD